MAVNFDKATQQLTFLYKLKRGLFPRSHGHHVARLAGLSEEVIDRAKRKSAQFEKKIGGGDPDEEELRQLVSLGKQNELRLLWRKEQKRPRT